MNEINERLAKALGLEWHEVRAYHAGRACTSCGIKISAIQSGPHPCENKNPNLLELVHVPCQGCSETGLICKVNGLCDHNRDGCHASEPCEGHTKPCPTCHGMKGRSITRLQLEMEERGKWILFKEWLWEQEERLKLNYADILTDTYKLGAAVAEFLEGE